MSIEAFAWPADRLDPAVARAWISSVLQGKPAVQGPVTVLQVKPWGFTVQFTAGGEAVIFKVGALPIYAYAPQLADLLAQHCPGQVPHLLAAAQQGDQTWSLFRPFAGPTVAETRRRSALLDEARTLAAIQVAMADVPSGDRAGIPESRIGDIPGWFDTLLEDVENSHAEAWAAGGGRLAAQFHMPDHFAERLARFRPQVARWAWELESERWPDSVDHVDLHSNNAVVQPDGRLLIFDWEEAVWSCPFFSLDRLLEDGREWDLGGDEARVLDRSGGPTPTEAELRAVYLDALPWGSREEREAACTLALALAPLKTAYEGRVFDQARGRPHPNPRLAAWCLTRALARWEGIGRG
jgi:hypothetical protein